VRGSKLRRKPLTELSYVATDPQIIGKNVVVFGLVRQDVEEQEKTKTCSFATQVCCELVLRHCLRAEANPNRDSKKLTQL